MLPYVMLLYCITRSLIDSHPTAGIQIFRPLIPRPSANVPPTDPLTAGAPTRPGPPPVKAPSLIGGAPQGRRAHRSRAAAIAAKATIPLLLNPSRACVDVLQSVGGAGRAGWSAPVPGRSDFPGVKMTGFFSASPPPGLLRSRPRALRQ